ncbi:hypothetical protein DPEC_G00031380 [Dallia pectoralis]|uniref:Uncharacterized protein n=1 Tax=Dallia pectoralis TaxID=75939 RepID=A0ACC2HCG9_DALPE|nr:hypothetical protein DPEC_G00031380 [Dallia pectoralis]
MGSRALNKQASVWDAAVGRVFSGTLLAIAKAPSSAGGSGLLPSNSRCAVALRAPSRDGFPPPQCGSPFHTGVPERCFPDQTDVGSVPASRDYNRRRLDVTRRRLTRFSRIPGRHSEPDL